MHQPLTITHKEGVGLADGEVEHHLWLVDGLHRIYYTHATIHTPYPVANFQFTSLNPFVVSGEKWMIGRGDKLLAINRQSENFFIDMNMDMQDGIVRGFAIYRRDKQ